MDINSVGRTNYAVEIKNNLPTTFNYSTKEKIEKYIKDLNEECEGITLKTNDFNISSRSGITVTLSPDLIKKALKDKDIDKGIRKTLKDLYKDKNKLKAYNSSKDGHKVLSVGFFIDSNERISCSIKLNKRISTSVNTKDKRTAISRMIEKQKILLKKKKDFQSSLYYKYIDLLSKNKFKSIDFTV